MFHLEYTLHHNSVVKQFVLTHFELLVIIQLIQVLHSIRKHTLVVLTFYYQQKKLQRVQPLRYKYPEPRLSLENVIQYMNELIRQLN